MINIYDLQVALETIQWLIQIEFMCEKLPLNT
jgi:hypothetical protein